MIQPSTAEMLRRVIQAQGRETRTTLPGKIVSYDAAKQRAVVSIPLLVTGGDESALEKLPDLHDVPVQHLGGNGLYIHIPLAPGDQCVVHFFEQDTTEYYETEADRPATTQRHGLSCYATPGVLTVAKAISGAGNSVIEIGGNDDFAALASLVNANFQAINDMFDAWTPAPNDGGAALKVLTGSLVFQGTASSKVAIGS